MKICGASNIGKIRTENQDCYKAGRAADGTFWLVLCDGMGGLRSGGAASHQVVDSLERVFQKKLPELADDALRGFMEDEVQRCNGELYRVSVVDGHLTMGTTLEAAVIRGHTAHLIHCGDSRAYRISRRRISQITTDHSMVQELVDSGRITPEETRRHPNKNIITHALGIEQYARLDYNIIRMAGQETLLLCSDGLSGLVLDEELADIVRKTEFYQIPDALVGLALQRGGTDNITAVLAQA